MRSRPRPPWSKACRVEHRCAPTCPADMPMPDDGPRWWRPYPRFRPLGRGGDEASSPCCAGLLCGAVGGSAVRDRPAALRRRWRAAWRAPSRRRSHRGSPLARARSPTARRPGSAGARGGRLAARCELDVSWHRSPRVTAVVATLLVGPPSSGARGRPSPRPGLPGLPFAAPPVVVHLAASPFADPPLRGRRCRLLVRRPALLGPPFRACRAGPALSAPRWSPVALGGRPTRTGRRRRFGPAPGRSTGAEPLGYGPTATAGRLCVGRRRPPIADHFLPAAPARVHARCRLISRGYPPWRCCHRRPPSGRRCGSGQVLGDVIVGLALDERRRPFTPARGRASSPGRLVPDQLCRADEGSGDACARCPPTVGRPLAEHGVVALGTRR